MKTPLLTAVASVLATTTARADVPPTDTATVEATARPTYSFDIGSHVRWLGDTSGAILTDQPLGGLRMTLGRSLTRLDVKSRDVALGVFARWVFATATGAMFDDALETHLAQHLLGAGVRFSAPLWRRVDLVGQAELGAAHTSLEIVQGDVMPVDDEHWTPYATASIGADLDLVRRRRFHLGLGLDLGYTVTVPTAMHALPGDRPDAELSIDTTFSSIGKLDLRGVTYAMSLRGSF